MLILASAQFIMVLDSSVMNVAISQIVVDLDTTIQGVQTAITLYTLVMAAFMLLGAKLGDILGTNRAFAIGLAIYGARVADDVAKPESHSAAHRMVGCRGIRCCPRGARDRRAHRRDVSGQGSRAGLWAARWDRRGCDRAGPLIGGWVTTEFSWRYVFAAETVVVIGILLVRGQLARAPLPNGARSSTSGAWRSPRPGAP